MARKVKHFSLHRIAETELRVVSDIDDGVLPIIQVEEAVVQEYVRHGHWRHKCVTLFVLQDMQPLARQFQSSSDEFPGRADVLDGRPVVNVYDLAEPAACNIFVNLEVMERQGYWDDPVAVRGLLAHEHAHPLAEGPTVQASRELRVVTTTERTGSTGSEETNGTWMAGVKQDAIQDLLNRLAHKLCLYAPREVFANETAIRSGFADALLHLNRRNVANALSSLAARKDIETHLQHGVDKGDMTPEAKGALLLVGDLQGYIDLALEVAPFYRAGEDAAAQELEKILEDEIFPRLEPEMRQAFAAFTKQYVDLRPDMTRDELQAWGKGVLNILAGTLAEKKMVAGFSVSTFHSNL